MIEYFKEQLEKTIPLTNDMINELKENRIANNLSTDSLNHYQEGDVVLHYMIESTGPTEDGSNVTLEVYKILEREVNDKLKDMKFVRMVGAMPIFTDGK